MFSMYLLLYSFLYTYNVFILTGFFSGTYNFSVKDVRLPKWVTSGDIMMMEHPCGCNTYIKLNNQWV